MNRRKEGLYFRFHTYLTQYLTLKLTALSGRCFQNGHKRPLVPEIFFISRKDMGHDKTRRCAPTLSRKNTNRSEGKRLGDRPTAPTGYRNDCC
ncbi:hypothetical protein QNI19_38885 [Cytophagaceae bacterium DM2B3-1]|uniref:Uncharacterized protein n=1 Tax=Xanthocytophaga flava TaxID=3048013 RepID=A0ABT7CYX5_9BACT|nr:hypothetical protein [Xanthocytophaga flavus]MDJ1498957.1 hypothetical protein [Xanthocytophaga flavus]